MPLNLPPETEAYIDRLVADGRYVSREDAVVRVMADFKREQEALDSLRAEIQIGLDQIDRGEFAPLDIEDTKRRLLERMKAKAGAVQ